MQILLNLSENLVLHIDSYQHHFKFKTRTEAIRDLLLKAFESVGNPLLNEPVTVYKGRPSAERKETKEKAERYKQIQAMLKLEGINLDD